MRRVFLVLTVALVMAAMIVASAMPAFAVASQRANCLGQLNADVNFQHQFGIPGLGGRLLANSAKESTPGFIGELASSNCGFTGGD